MVSKSQQSCWELSAVIVLRVDSKGMTLMHDEYWKHKRAPNKCIYMYMHTFKSPQYKCIVYIHMHIYIYMYNDVFYLFNYLHLKTARTPVG